MRVGSLISRNCAACQQPDCCQLNGSPFFLTEFDVSRIASRTGLRRDKFVRLAEDQDQDHLTLRTKADGTCIFYDASAAGSRRCQVYASRPLDCRLYPFTVELIGIEYYWVQYSACADRYVSNRIEQLLEHLERTLLPRFSAAELARYATADAGGPAVALKRTVIRKVRFP